MIKISPSVLSADFSNLETVVKETEAAGAEYIHLDVMDGCFVPNLTFGAPVIAAMRKHGTITFDVHLMICEPIRYIEDFYKAGADIITIHLEACEDVKKTLEKIKSYGVKAGISIKPKTDVSELIPYIEYLDLILIMSVEPGFGGQAFIPYSTDKIRKTREIVNAHKPDILIEVDGGITTENIAEIYKAGADIAVAGSSVYRAKGMTVKEAVEALKQKSVE